VLGRRQKRAGLKLDNFDPLKLFRISSFELPIRSWFIFDGLCTFASLKT
jgi:hypothetical protein